MIVYHAGNACNNWTSTLLSNTPSVSYCLSLLGVPTFEGDMQRLIFTFEGEGQHFETSQNGIRNLQLGTEGVYSLKEMI